MTLKPDTAGGRLLRALVCAYPKTDHDGYTGGPDELGNDFHKAASRLGDTLKPRGFTTVERTRKDHGWSEYRLSSAEVYLNAALLVYSWVTGKTVAELRAAGTCFALPGRDCTRQATLPLDLT